MTTLEAQQKVITELILEKKKLERERDEVRNKLADALQEVDLRTLDYERMKQERDEAREALKDIEEYGTDEINAAVELRQQLASALVERDKAQEDATNYYAKIGELIEERDDALSQIVQAECRAERFCQERDEAIENLDEEKKFHHRTHSELVQTQCKILDLTQAIIATLEENRHLADGDDCTLAKLKSVFPEWE